MADVSDWPRGTVTFLFTDVEGSTRLWQDYPQEMPAAYARHDSILREAVTSHGGVVYKVVGDAFQAVFPTTPQAVTAAIEAQRALLAEAWPTPEPLRVRMALHTVAAAPQPDGDYRTPGLNRLGRLLATAAGGQVLLSGVTAELAHDQLPPGGELRDLGPQRLKDLYRPEHVYELIVPGQPGASPPPARPSRRPGKRRRPVWRPRSRWWPVLLPVLLVALLFSPLYEEAFYAAGWQRGLPNGEHRFADDVQCAWGQIRDGEPDRVRAACFEQGTQPTVAVGQNCRLGQPIGKVFLYTEADYGGECEEFIGHDTNLGDNPIGIDRIRSVMVGPGVRLMLCAQSDYRGPCSVLVHGYVDDDPVMGLYRTLDTYRISDEQGSLKVIPADAGPEPEEVFLYSEPNFGGDRLYLAVGEALTDFTDTVLHPSGARSAQVGSGAVVTVCKRPLFTECMSFGGQYWPDLCTSWPDLSDMATSLATYRPDLSDTDIAEMFAMPTTCVFSSPPHSAQSAHVSAR